MGRLTKEPDVRYSQGENSMAIARYTLAVDRKKKDDGADFVNCVAFGKAGEFAEKFFHKGTKIVVVGRIQTGNYTNKDGATVYTTDVVAEEQEFAESKSTNASGNSNPVGALPNSSIGSIPSSMGSLPNQGFMNIPEGINEELPFARPSR